MVHSVSCSVNAGYLWFAKFVSTVQRNMSIDPWLCTYIIHVKSPLQMCRASTKSSLNFCLHIIYLEQNGRVVDVMCLSRRRSMVRVSTTTLLALVEFSGLCTQSNLRLSLEWGRRESKPMFCNKKVQEFTRHAQAASDRRSRDVNTTQLIMLNLFDGRFILEYQHLY